MAKPTPSFLKALGRRPLPPSVTAKGKTYALVRVFKHDFFAATAEYEGDAGKVLLKVGRQARCFGIPLRWVGRWLAKREMAALEKLAGVRGIPRLIDRWEDTGFVRDFVDGQPLAKGMHVRDEFHDELSGLVDVIHKHGMAYVDLEKCENVLVGDDGKPHLFDFQISWQWSRSWGGEFWPVRRLRRFFQNGDRYHLVKLKRRTRPDLMSPEALAASYRRPWTVRVHRFVTWPFTAVRRAVLNKIDPRAKRGERGRVSENDSIGAT
ncbi:MAG: hypothetical protein ACPGXK_06970 [Phycisphaerae bacterium]